MIGSAHALPGADRRDLGIVVIGRNEGERLVRCLRSLKTAGGAIVYVDSGSTDQSMITASQHGATAVALDRSLPFGAARARNAGVIALGEIAPFVEFVQFVDGDCEVAEEWVAIARQYLRRHPTVAVVCGRRRERYPQRSMFNRLCDLEWDTPVGDVSSCGGDAMMRLTSFNAVAGFDTRLTAGEEAELCQRLRAQGGQIHRVAHEMTVHDAALLRWGQWWRRCVRSGFGYSEAWRRSQGRAVRLYQRELGRALLWGAAVPGVFLVLVIVSPGLSIIPVLLVGTQLVRIALHQRAQGAFAFRYAALMMISKVAEASGVFRYLLASSKGGPQYK